MRHSGFNDYPSFNLWGSSPRGSARDLYKSFLIGLLSLDWLPRRYLIPRQLSLTLVDSKDKPNGTANKCLAHWITEELARSADVWSRTQGIPREVSRSHLLCAPFVSCVSFCFVSAKPRSEEVIRTWKSFEFQRPSIWKDNAKKQNQN